MRSQRGISAAIKAIMFFVLRKNHIPLRFHFGQTSRRLENILHGLFAPNTNFTDHRWHGFVIMLL